MGSDSSHACWFSKQRKDAVKKSISKSLSHLVVTQLACACPKKNDPKPSLDNPPIVMLFFKGAIQ